MRYSHLLVLTPTASLWAQSLKPRLRQVVALPACKEKFRLYLLLGQSNMAGRGVVEAADNLPNRHVPHLNAAGQWEIAKDPVYFDKPVAGVGPGLTFGRTLTAQDTTLVTGLIPCALGGSGFDAWPPGAYFADTQTHPYNDALTRARQAQQSGTRSAAGRPARACSPVRGGPAARFPVSKSGRRWPDYL